jgi:hypothetical protein
MQIWSIDYAAPTYATGRFVLLARALFVCTALYAGVLFWIAPHPPLADLPQQAGQVELLRGLIERTSSWQTVVRTNYLTPYLVGYALALPLTFIMPVAAALKLVMTVAYYAFVVCCVLLRRRFSADDRLDWLFIPGFFGFAFGWGFYTYLVAAPLGLLFVLIVHDYAAAPTRTKGTAVFLSAIILFFSHALVFLFACAIGIGIIVAKQKRLTRIVLALLPFLPLGILCIVYAVASQERDPMLALHAFSPQTLWYWNRRRAFAFLLNVWFADGNNIVSMLASLAMLAAPWLLRDRINRRDPAVAIPLLTVLIIWFLIPSTAMKIGYLYERFALYFLPAYAFVFVAADRARNLSAGTTHPLRDGLVQLMMMATCWGFLGLQTVRMHRFAVESAAFDTLLAITAPGQRALSLVFDASSTAYQSQIAYRHYPTWYQAEKDGFVDINFAWFLPQIVRFKPGQLPAVPPDFENTPAEFDWKKNGGRLYRYFFVRNKHAMPAKFFHNDECDVVLVRKVDDWSLYERRTCR